MEETRQHPAVNVTALGGIHAISYGGAFWVLAASLILALLNSPYGVWGFAAWLLLLALSALANIIGAFSAGVVFRWAKPIDRNSDSTYYVFNLGVSIAIVALTIAFAALMVMFRFVS